MNPSTLSVTLEHKNQLKYWLDNIDSLFHQHDSIEAILQRASQIAVELFEIEHCVITWLGQDKSPVEIRANFRHGGENRDYVRAPTGQPEKIRASFESEENDLDEFEQATNDKLVTPLQIENEIVGDICIAKRKKQTATHFSSTDQNLFFALSRHIAHAIEMQQMRQFMASRYVSAALNHNKEGSNTDQGGYFSNFLYAVKHPDKVAKIIARSFYKDLRKAGFETKQILVVASEIIENLNETFRKTKAKTDEVEN